jgi:hypothetical protein
MGHHTRTNAGNNGMQTNGGKINGGQQNGRRCPGRGYQGFSNFSWLPAFGAFAFYSPEDTTWYYWYEPSDSFLPVSYIVEYPPVNSAGANSSFDPTMPTAPARPMLPWQ